MEISIFLGVNQASKQLFQSAMIISLATHINAISEISFLMQCAKISNLPAYTELRQIKERLEGREIFTYQALERARSLMSTA